MEYPYLGFKNANGSDKLSQETSVIVFFTSENQGVVVHNNNVDNPNELFGKYGTFNEDDFYFYPEENTVILQN